MMYFPPGTEIGADVTVEDGVCNVAGAQAKSAMLNMVIKVKKREIFFMSVSVQLSCRTSVVAAANNYIEQLLFNILPVNF